MRKDSTTPFRAVSSSTLEVESGEHSERDETGRALAPPDPEVVDTPARRRFSAEYKLRILRQADACTEPGSLGALLRSEGLYASNLRTWRRQIEVGTLEALKPGERGIKPTAPISTSIRPKAYISPSRIGWPQPPLPAPAGILPSGCSTPQHCARCAESF